MKNAGKKLLSAILVVAMLVSLAPAVYATEADTGEEALTQIETTVQDTAGQEEVSTEPGENGTDAEPAEGGEDTDAEPAEGGEDTDAEPAEGGEDTDAEPAEGGEGTDAEPAEGGEDTDAEPAEGGEGTDNETSEGIIVVDDEEVIELFESTDQGAMAAAGIYAIGRTENNLAKGASYEELILKDKNKNQTIAYLTTIDLSENLKLKASYTGYYTANSTVAERAEKELSWTLSSVTSQAADYETIADPEGTVIWGTNGDYYNMQTGAPIGYLIMEGNLVKTGNEPYFAILDDGTAEIRDAGTDYSDVVEAISGPFYLIKDGEIAVGNDGEQMPRNSVGIDADGNVIFLEADGRQAPYRVGMSCYEVACILLDAGCVDALYLDGGGSATVAARVEGSDELKVVNSPSDGIERTVSDAMLLISTEDSDGVFDHASVSPKGIQYTPNSTVTFEAIGVDVSGGSAPLPESGLSWALAADSAAAGTMDAATGVFTAATNYVGPVNVQLSYNGAVVGSSTITIIEPDELYFANEAVSLDFGAETDLGLTVKGAELDVVCKDGDFTWTVTPPAGASYGADDVGTVSNNIFTAGPKTGATLTGTVEVSYTNLSGVTISDTIEVEIGKMPTVLLDFEETPENGILMGANAAWGYRYAFPNVPSGLSGVSTEGFGTAGTASVDPNGVTIPQTLDLTGPNGAGLACGDFINSNPAWQCSSVIPYKWDCTKDPGILYNQMGYNYYSGAISSAADGVWNTYAKLVNASEGPVRFGNQALEFHYDYTQITGKNNTNEFLVYSGDEISIDGSPSAIGMWVYAPEGTPNFWLSTYISYWNGSGYSSYGLLHFKTTTVDAAGNTVNTTTQYTGINWEGWRYMEADLSPVYTKAAEVSAEHPLKIMPGQYLLNMIIIEGGTSDVNGNKITCGARASGSIYIDNVRAVYGTTTDDLQNPVITSVKGGAASLSTMELTNLEEDGSTVLTTNELQFFTEYNDPHGENYSGISTDDVVIKIDGEAVERVSNADQAVTYAVSLANGRHTISVEIMDNFGNRASTTRSFTVNNPDSDLPTVIIDYMQGAPLGGDFVIDFTTNDISGIDSITAKVVYGNVDKFDTAENGGQGPHQTSAQISYGDGFTGSYTAARSTTAEKTVTIEATSSGSATGSNVIRFALPVASSLTALDNLPLSVSVTYQSGEHTYSVSTGKLTIPIVASYVITNDPMITGAESGTLSVVDIAGEPAAGVKIYVQNDGDASDTELGVTDENGQWTGVYFCEKEAGTVSVIYAEKDGALSFKTNITTLNAGGEELPSMIQLNISGSDQNTQNISWIANPMKNEHTAIVEYDTQSAYTENGTLSKRAEGTSTNYPFALSGDAALINTVTVTGLTPGTTYSYRVGDGKNWSDVQTFTVSNPEDNTTNFFVVADTQLGGSADPNAVALMNYVADHVNKTDVDFGIQTGDFVDNAGYLSQWETILDIFTQNYPDIPIAQVMGNHEYYGDVSGSAAELMWMLENELYYSVEYNDVYIAVMNYAANVQEAAEWLKQDAAKSDCTWKILAVHQPPYYTNPKGSSEAFNRYIPAAAQEAGINMVFSGHDHSYARTEVLKDGQVVASTDENGTAIATYGEGIVYFICGDFGEKSRSIEYAIDNNPDFHFAVATQNYTAAYVSVSATENSMTVTAYDIKEDGSADVLDTFTMYKADGACEKNGHVLNNPVYTNGKLICSSCGKALDPAEVSYTGWAVDGASELPMFFVAGEFQTGEFLMEETTYYFDENGVALDGPVTVDGVEMEFDRGLLIGGYTGFIRKADGNTYHYIDGKMTYGWFEFEGDWYHFDGKTGVMCTEKHVMPDDEAISKKAYYDFGEDGKLLYGYFNPSGYYYWAGLPKRDSWVKTGDDPDSWYRTNSSGHFVKDTTGNPTVVIEINGVQYTFDNTNGKLLKGSIVNREGVLYYYWAGRAVNNGWFEFDGDIYYAFSDGSLATGETEINGVKYTFSSIGKLQSEELILSISLSKDLSLMTIAVLNVDEDMTDVSFTLTNDSKPVNDKFAAERVDNSPWTVTVPLCQYDLCTSSLFHVKVNGVEDGKDVLVTEGEVNVIAAPTHVYTDEHDATCNNCGRVRKTDLSTTKTTPMYRLYNPFTGEHFYTGSTEERDALSAIGWKYEGVAWNAPVSGGIPVHRVCNPNSGDHHYTTDMSEVLMLLDAGWQYENICWNSAFSDAVAQYRMWNKNADLGSHHYTSSTEERQILVDAGWIFEGIGWYGLTK